MISSGIVVFREVLEAAIVISIVLAATRGIARRNLWVNIGIAGGLLGAVIVAAFTETITGSLEGIGQEILNAGVLFIAAMVLAWAVVWMRTHGRVMAQRLAKIGRDVSEGELPLYILAIVVGLAVLREGAETVLFLYGIAAVPGAEPSLMLTGGLMGLVGGGVVGLVMYFGLLRIPSKHLFNVTGWLLAFLAAGMASQSAGYLVAVDQLPPLVNVVWDSSKLLSGQSLLGQFMSTLIGYDPRPSGIQLVFYVATLGTITFLVWLSDKKMASKAALAVVVCFTSWGALLGGAEAHHKVYSPIVEGGELGLEWRGHIDSDEDSEVSGNRRQIYEVEAGITDRWLVALFGEARSTASREFYYKATAFETIYQLFEQGEHFLDAGLYLELKKSQHNYDKNIVEGKLLFEKSFTHLTHTLNLTAEDEVGPKKSKGTEFQYAWGSKYRWKPWLIPGFELYGKPGRFHDFTAFDEQTLQIGPVVSGKVPLKIMGAKLAYEVGYLSGATKSSPDGTFKWLLELERHF